MNDKKSNFTRKEMEDLQSIVTDTLSSVCAMADDNNIDRDSMLKYFADMLTVFTEVATIQNYKTNHTNADRIRNMSDEDLMDILFNSCLERMNINECPYADNVGKCKKCILDWLQAEAE